jgi:hypothetical protein
MELVKFFLLSEPNLLNQKQQPQESFIRNYDYHDNNQNYDQGSSNIKTLLSYLSTFNNYDISKIEATKTDLVNFYEQLSLNNNNSNNTNADKNKPFITIRTFFDFSEFFELNNLRSMIKLIIVLNLNLTLTLLNVVLISFLALSNEDNWRIGFLKNNLLLNMAIFTFLLLLNSSFMLIVNKYHQSVSSFSSLNRALFNFLNDLLVNKKAVNLNNYHLIGSKSKMVKTISIQNNSVEENVIPSDFQSLLTQKCSNSINFSYLKLNLVFMVISLVLLLVYSFLIDSEKSEKEHHVKINDENEEDELLILEEGYKEKKESSIVDYTIFEKRFFALKKKKLNKKISFDLQFIIQCFFIVYLLGIWDIADVFQYFRMQNWQKSNMNFLLSENSGYSQFLNTYSDIVAKNTQLNNMKNQTSGTKFSLLSNYYNKFSNKFYQHDFLHEFNLELDHNNDSISLNEDGSSNYQSLELKSTTRIKALFMIKMHSRFFADFLIIIFVSIVIFKLDCIEHAYDRFMFDQKISSVLDF